MNTIQVNFLPLDGINVNPSNPRTITELGMRKLVDSILELPKMLGLRPIVVDCQNVILGGNMRYRALTAIADMSENEMLSRVNGLKALELRPAAEKDELLDYWITWKDNPTAPVVCASDLTAAEMREFIIKDNGMFGDWDLDALANEWDDLPLGDFGVDMDFMKGGPDTDGEDGNSGSGEGRITIRCGKGDTWLVGERVLSEGESIELEELKKLLGK